jgi:hypothetical protein
MAYNVTAVAQSDSDGFGPAYLLNGLSDSGYWYQVGLSYNWPYLNGGYDSGFHMNYEVFDPSANSIFPADGSGGLKSLSGVVYQGDEVLLNLYFSGGQIVMLVKDTNTGASASVSYTAEGTKFIGLSWTGNSKGFFTGLMTEWIHTSAYYGGEGEVKYSNPSFALSSAYMWAVEFDVSNRSSVQFSDHQQISFANPHQIQTLATNGATEYADAYTFITGALNERLLTLSYSVISGGSGYAPPILTFVYNGVHQNMTLGTVPTTFLADPGTSWSVSSALQGGSGSERWVTNRQTNGNVTTSLSTILEYYHQFSVTFRYEVIGAGATYSPLAIVYTQFGSPESTTTGSSVWVDAGSSYSYPASLQGSFALERWSTPRQTGTVNGAGDITARFYQQFPLFASYSILGGGGATSPGLTGIQYGGSYTASLTTTSGTYWLDAGSTWNLATLLYGSTDQERWQTNSTTSGMIITPSTIYPTFYHQYALTLSYSIAGGGNPIIPAMTGKQFGHVYTAPLTVNPTLHFLDAGSNWTLSNSLSGGSSQERWQMNETATSTISGSSTVVAIYYHQYYTSSSLAPLAGGSITAPNGWYDKGTTLQLSASPNIGWKFEGWVGAGSGSYTGGNNSTSFIVSGPVLENATFYPGLKISAGDGGSVSYVFGITSGMVLPGTSQTIYAPVGTTVSLASSPSSLLYDFTGWSTSTNGTSGGILVSLVSPEVVQASFSINYGLVGGVAGALIVVIAASNLLIRRRRTHSETTVGP